MNSTLRSIVLVACVIMFSGCVISNITNTPGARYRQTDPSSVELLYQEPARPYQVVGFVAVDRGTGASDEKVEREFRSAAAKLGAQALIIESLPVHGFITTVQGKGKAVRWKE